MDAPALIIALGPLAAPLSGAVFAVILPRRAGAWTSVFAAAALLAAGILLDARTLHCGIVHSGLLRADALTAWLLTAIGAVAVIACWAGVHYLADEAAAGELTEWQARRYLLLVQ